VDSPTGHLMNDYIRKEYHMQSGKKKVPKFKIFLKILRKQRKRYDSENERLEY
jgi:hypothetical protein